MSLKFLAVGPSLAGIRGEKSPYELNKGNQLPTFASAPRFTARAGEKDPQAMVQTDFLHAPKTEESAPAGGKANASIFQPTQPPPVAPKRRRRWLSFLRMRWFRAPFSRTDLVQTELTLEKVRVIRNDLADSDLQLVLKRKKKAKAVFSPTQENNGLPRQGWSELTAKLFELGQK